LIINHFFLTKPNNKIFIPLAKINISLEDLTKKYKKEEISTDAKEEDAILPGREPKKLPKKEEEQKNKGLKELLNNP
jgi:hypothetical protein